MILKFRMLALLSTFLLLGSSPAVRAEGPVRVLISDKPAPTRADPLTRYLQQWRLQHRGVAPSHPLPPDPDGTKLLSQTAKKAHEKSRGCIVCHLNTGDMHTTGTVNLGCTDCHGGNPTEEKDKHLAHISPNFPDAWRSSANPVRSYTLLNRESPEFIRFVNPGDLRIAHATCGKCHPNEVLQVKKSMMTHGCMLWGAALYNNGAFPAKHARFGESYSMHGVPQRIFTVPPPTDKEILEKGVLPFLDPLPRFEVSQPGNILRYFERGGRFRAELGIPERLEEPGRPRERLSLRGPGTQNRTDPVFIGLQKTRLLDPTLNFLGTNDHPGDYRSSGCTACHVVYANDRSEVHSGPFARFGNQGLSFSGDPTIPRDEPGHPITHKFTVGIPTSQCIVCHVHPGTNVLNSYLGFMWWDNETDGELMYPEEQKYPTAEEVVRGWMANPEEASLRGKWSDPEFLNNVTDLNDKLQHTQFADFHGHGWVFRAVFKKDRKGNLLDHAGKIVAKDNAGLQRAMVPPTAQERVHGKKRDGTPVHLMDIHLEKGMHCVDCHFSVDSHGNTKLYGEVRAAIEIRCVDCHGSATESVLDKIAATLKMPTTGPAAPPDGTNLLGKSTPFGKPRFEVVDGDLIQHSMVEEGLCWVVVQTAATMNPESRHYNVKSHMAKTVRFSSAGKLAWGGDGSDPGCAHQGTSMSCIACHSSWNPSCFGCHLPQRANAKMADLHNEGSVSRNYTSYNFQTLRDDVYMLGRDGNVTKNRIGPVRSACAIHVTSYNARREAIYSQQQTVSSSGMSGISFSSNVPHTVRGGEGYQGGVTAGTHETKMCSDCHLSTDDDNNALMAQLLMQGTNYTNFIGKYCWIATGHHGLEAVVVTEDGEPQAVIGSTLHKLAYPDNYQEHEENHHILEHAHEHPGVDIWDQLKPHGEPPKILDLQARGEYLYAACGPAGIRVFDIAFVDDKAFSERITTAPVSPRGQKFFYKTPYATAVAAPATIVPDPTRIQSPINDEEEIPRMYAFIYVTDKQWGLVSVFARTLLDGNPLNNFIDQDNYLARLSRETGEEFKPIIPYNPGGMLNDATNLTIVGHYAYICCERGLAIVDIENPFQPRFVRMVSEGIVKPRAVQVQFRYAFVCDMDGVKVLDVTNLEAPEHVAALPMRGAKNIYVARTYAYVAAGTEGLKILDVSNPRKPMLDQVFNAKGKINKLQDVTLGITNVSEFAYLADGHNGLHVVQLTSASTPGNNGFSPRPVPRLIATYKPPHNAEVLAVSEGIDRDRAVDESGNQIAVFGRVGAGPLSQEDQQRMYLRNGRPWKVNDNPFDGEVYRFPAEIQRRAFRPPPADSLRR